MGALCGGSARIHRKAGSNYFLGPANRYTAMTEDTSKQEKRRTPEDATDFERDQLRFLLSEGDLATMLAALNPSLAWLPFLSQMKLIKGETQLAAWVERNFADVQAVRDVVANIRFFGPDTANILEYRL